MKILHVVSCCLLSALCVVVSPGTKEVVGGHVMFSCSFFWAGTNNKYFCKGTCSGRDILVETKRSKNVTQGRYSIEDNRDGVFYVTIKNLMKSDSGTYWCGVERSGLDTYQEVNLTVTDAPPTSTTSTVTSRRHVSTTLPDLSTTSPNTSSTLPNHISGRLSRAGKVLEWTNTVWENPGEGQRRMGKSWRGPTPYGKVLERANTVWESPGEGQRRMGKSWRGPTLYGKVLERANAEGEVV
ncbi:CMRF35-like molecule 5 [Oncorhynchus clarkii lewisi]|uniref:CMRF35-like molecule 5 n=1 Tax=Oncorhynchus clarkii lewisi TaxID=490388 RepID=UPI0039B90290